MTQITLPFLLLSLLDVDVDYGKFITILHVPFDKETQNCLGNFESFMICILGESLDSNYNNWANNEPGLDLLFFFK